jgi:hypothetical protein
MTTQPECHLFVILAREAHRAVIFRRGPRIWTQLILWDTDTDTFIEGQWFKGKVYTKRCDVSPDGSKLVYFSAKHYKRPKPYGEVQNNWTAISRPPFWTALAMWDSAGTWGGGGFFEDNQTLCANFYSGDDTLRAEDLPWPSWFRVVLLSSKYQVGINDGLYFDVLLPHGSWAMIQGEGRRYQYPSVWRKSSPDHSFDLLMTL